MTILRIVGSGDPTVEAIGAAAGLRRRRGGYVDVSEEAAMALVALDGITREDPPAHIEAVTLPDADQIIAST